MHDGRRSSRATTRRSTWRCCPATRGCRSTIWCCGCRPARRWPRSASVELAPGDRLLVAGASGAGKSSFFRALSGLWPLGEGTIHFPEHAKVFTLPQRAYFPLGSLRQAIAYPTLVEHADDEAIREALRAVGLPHLDRSPRRGGRLADRAGRRRAAARRLRPRAAGETRHPLARRAGLGAGGGRRRRALPPARRAAAARHRHHHRPRRAARPPA